MATARDLMHSHAHCIQAHDTAGNAARMLAEHDIGALPICDAEGVIKGILTDRDLAIQVMAAGFDPEAFEVGDLPQQPILVLAEVDEDADLVLAKMSENQVRRVPVVEAGAVVGMISQADVALTMPEPIVGEVVGAVSASR
ncbi:CBS domain-containing protein [Glycomyces buryatensis]|uniref:CBS domain-containing protein n=1 Tax=Glycomyces buryatensis TaxID=2570927 RepID=A0A4S8Q9R9_9ACTN|nr:CBS domain-containing protein [Glycomyces buryatensis]THV39542.1 CBS domain-containing protein [Glycomyces buryatensis]